MQTVVGFFDNHATAQRVQEALLAEGFRADEVRVEANTTTGTMTGGMPDQTTGATGATTRRADDDSIGERISNFFGSLFGSDYTEEERGYYTDAMRRGNAVVTVSADDARVDRAEEILARFDPIDVDQQAATYRDTADFTTNRRAVAGDETVDQAALQVVEEQMNIGKRAVERGGVRIVRHVSERPVEETVHLREERVNVERHPVDRALNDADMAAFREGTIEVTEMAEEAVVSKQQRVVEEVLVNKEVVEHDETIRDTVRRSDVDVEPRTTEERRRTQTSGR